MVSSPQACNNYNNNNKKIEILGYSYCTICRFKQNDESYTKCLPYVSRIFRITKQHKRMSCRIFIKFKDYYGDGINSCLCILKGFSKFLGIPYCEPLLQGSQKLFNFGQEDCLDTDNT